MLRPVWGCVVAVMGVLWFYSSGVQSQCWEHSQCRDLSSEANILECIQACKVDLSAESPLFPGNGHLQPTSEDIQNYVMSHFHWNTFGQRMNGTPGGSKREGASTTLSVLLEALSQPRDEVERESEEEEGLQQHRRDDKRSYSMEHFRWGKPVGRKRRPVKVYPNEVEEESAESYPAEIRRDLSLKLDYPQGEELEEVFGGENDLLNLQEKKDGSYKMNHFRWSGPPKDKRYGGFMKSWDERSQKPLLTLFKNVMIKDGHEKKGQ
uniref:Proopiomelanocortin A n=2 Tax=Acipenser TaxID=7901 RepID=B0FRG1_ACISI|nr:proopiomelanocortin A precursor [Acipenser sinensis]ACD12131.1 proopiomelanocortin A [Acipenser sinensis]QPP11598.1 proopiomelanocortin [Acipenser dabryanus]